MNAPVDGDDVVETLRRWPVPPLPKDAQVNALQAARAELAFSAPAPPPTGVLGWSYAAGVPVLLVSAGAAHLALSIAAMVRIWG